MSMSPVSPVVHTSHEARSEGLKVYRTCFKDGLGRGLIYINPRMDTLFVTVPEYTKDWMLDLLRLFMGGTKDPEASPWHPTSLSVQKPV